MFKRYLNITVETRKLEQLKILYLRNQFVLILWLLKYLFFLQCRTSLYLNSIPKFRNVKKVISSTSFVILFKGFVSFKRSQSVVMILLY